jgi:hypothetical protein
MAAPPLPQAALPHGRLLLLLPLPDQVLLPLLPDLARLARPAPVVELLSMANAEAKDGPDPQPAPRVPANTRTVCLLYQSLHT